MGMFDPSERDLIEQGEKLRKMAKALIKYGRHEASCSSYKTSDPRRTRQFLLNKCNCGFREVFLAAYEEVD